MRKINLQFLSSIHIQKAFRFGVIRLKCMFLF